MNGRELHALLERLDVRPSRRLGQNFLVDPNLLEAMVRQADITPGERVLEVGPGTGILTRRLLAAGADVTAVELDRRLAAYLRETFADEPRFRLLEQDACKVDYDELYGQHLYRCIANLPYACSSVFLAAMVQSHNAPVQMHVLLQREMAERMSAASGSKIYGALSVKLQLRYTVTVLRYIPPEVFMPPPEVGSAFVHFQLLAEPLPEAVRNLAAQLAGVAFSQRRKKCGKIIAAGFGDPGRCAAAFAATGINPDDRAERLAPGDFARLAACLIHQ